MFGTTGEYLKINLAQRNNIPNDNITRLTLKRVKSIKNFHFYETKRKEKS